jgi:integrase
LTAEPHPKTRFRKAIEGGWVFPAELAARELGNLTLGEALQMVCLYAEHEPAKFERAALRWHDLRHVAASLLMGEGASVAYVSRVLGHAHPAITLSTYEFAAAEHADRRGSGWSRRSERCKPCVDRRASSS